MKTPPVMVYTMGKVGTVSFANSLREAGILAWQAHWLTPAKHPVAEYPSSAFPAMHQMIQNDTIVASTVIIPVREPAARSLSSFMQSRNRFGAPEDAETMFQKATQEYKVEWADQWFEDELKRYWHFDAFEHPFDHEKGYSIYEHGRHKMVIIRLENANEAFPIITEQLFDRSIVLQKANSWNYRLHEKGHLLSEFQRMKDMPMPKEFLDRCYNMKYAQHFYTDEERAEFRRSWENGS